MLSVSKNTDIKSQLEAVFGKVITENNSEFRVNCPECENRANKKDYKFKLYINPFKTNDSGERGTWNCFRCSFKGWDLKKLGVTYAIAAELKPRTKAKPTLNIFHEGKSKEKRKKKQTIEIPLPPTFTQNWSKSLLGRACFKYLNEERGVTTDIIAKHSIGYCTGGRYRNHIVFPIYKGSKLIYYVTRSIYKKIYMNCPGKNSHVLFNFNNQNHVIITEGIFDALRVGDNGVALLGKIIKKEQLNIILKSKVKKVTILLDKDAFKDANLISDKLSGFSFEVRLAFPNTSKDPGELRPEQIDEIIKEAWNEVR